MKVMKNIVMFAEHDPRAANKAFAGVHFGLAGIEAYANDIADGYIFLTVSKDATGVGYYVMILENDGTVVWYNSRI